VLFLIAENDSRCPYRQAMAYVDRLAAREHPHEGYVFATGHVSLTSTSRSGRSGRSSTSYAVTR